MSSRNYRFAIVPHEYAGQTKPRYFHCCTKREWQSYISPYFEQRFYSNEISYSKTVSNASFRLPTLEIKLGLLLADDEVRVPQNSANDVGLLSGAVRPGFVIDSVLSIFSLLEGLGTLSWIASLPGPDRSSLKNRQSRKNKFTQGVAMTIGRECNIEIDHLTSLRDRCIHQDCADLQDDLDYKHVFMTSALMTSVSLLNEYLDALGDGKRTMPKSNLDLFVQETRRPASLDLF